MGFIVEASPQKTFSLSPKLPKKAIRSRGRLLLIKASMMKGKGLKGKKNKDNKVKDGSKKKDNKVKDGAKKKHKKVEEGNKEKDKPEEGNKEKDTNVEEGNQKKVKKALKKGNRKNGKISKSSKDPPVVPRAKVAAKAKAKIAPKAKAAARAAAVDADEKKALAKKLHAATWRGNLKLQYWLPTWQDFQLLFIASIRYCHHNGSHIAILFVLCNAVSCVSFFFLPSGIFHCLESSEERWFGRQRHLGSCSCSQEGVTWPFISPNPFSIRKTWI